MQYDCASKVRDARKDLSEELPTLGDVARETTFEGTEVLVIAQVDVVSVELNDALRIVFSI